MARPSDLELGGSSRWLNLLSLLPPLSLFIYSFLFAAPSLLASSIVRLHVFDVSSHPDSGFDSIGLLWSKFESVGHSTPCSTLLF